MDNQKEFKPYVPAEKVTPEITLTSIIMGVLLAVVFGAANAYLGLRVGMTVSASIPAAVIAMGVIRVAMRRNSILESNVVQTVGSAGESLAAGAIFTLPALFLWAKDGVMDKPGIIEITIIALLGGLLGVFFMIPLRNALIVREHGVLPYPEGTACAEVLLAGEEGGANASTVFAGMGFAAAFKFIIDGIKAVPGEVSFRVKGYAGEIGTQIYPAVMSVGYICGPRISSYMFDGGLLVLQLLVNREEVHDFVEDVGGQLVDGLDAMVGGVREGNRNDLVVQLTAVVHPHTADGVDLHQGHGVDGLGAQHQHVQGVAVVGVGAGDEAVVGGVVGSGVEHAVQTAHTVLFVQLILAG